MLSFIVVQMFPGAIILIPYYVLMFQLGLINQLVSLVIMYSVTALPFVLWFLKGFFDTIPVDLEEAAMVDGATRAGALWRGIIPLSLPAIRGGALFLLPARMEGGPPGLYVHDKLEQLPAPRRGDVLRDPAAGVLE